MRALPPTVAAVLLAVSSYGREGRGHYVPGDPDPGRAIYLLPGPLVSLAVPLRGGNPPLLMDVGVEVSAHRFIPTTRRVWAQCGYGAFAQVQLGGVEVQPGDAPAPSMHLRVALGAQATFGVLGAHAGLVTRAAGSDQADMFGALAGVFFSFGLATGGFHVELPFAHVGDGASMPALFVGTFTLKWPINVARE